MEPETNKVPHEETAQIRELVNGDDDSDVKIT